MQIWRILANKFGFWAIFCLFKIQFFRFGEIEALFANYRVNYDDFRETDFCEVFVKITLSVNFGLFSPKTLKNYPALFTFFGFCPYLLGEF